MRPYPIIEKARPQIVLRMFRSSSPASPYLGWDGRYEDHQAYTTIGRKRSSSEAVARRDTEYFKRSFGSIFGELLGGLGHPRHASSVLQKAATGILLGPLSYLHTPLYALCANAPAALREGPF